MNETPVRSVVITGASGVVGKALVAHLTSRGYRVVTLTRGDDRDMTPDHHVRHWTPDRLGPWVGHMEGAEAFVNLAGEPVVGGHWTVERKRLIRGSRIDATRTLVAAIARLDRKPAVFLSASSRAYYGNHDSPERLTESSPCGADFLAQVMVEWEREADQVARHGVRSVQLRFGYVLAPGEALMGKIEPPFRWFLGGPFAPPANHFSWVHYHDVVGVVAHLIATRHVDGPVNVVAPTPTTVRDFANTLGGVLGRPSALPILRWVLTAKFGREAAKTLFTGRNIAPEALLQAGYRFAYSDIKSTLEDIVLGHRKF